jgi:hypothetical protein
MKRAEEILSAGALGYLQSTRFNLPINNILRRQGGDFPSEYYDPFVSYLSEIGEVFGIQAEVGLVYTDMMRSEAISSKGKRFIVHDQYFGQVINMMNRLLVYDASHETKVIYFHKIASQILSRYGFYKESIYSADFYRGLRGKMNHQKKQEQAGSGIHGFYTSIQEVFVLLHEQAHIIFKSHPDLLQAASVGCRAWLNEFGESKTELSDEQFAAVLQGLPVREQQELTKQRDAFAHYQRMEAVFCEEIVSRPDLVEEFCCDEIALINTLGYFSSKYFMLKGSDEKHLLSTEQKVSAILLCFLNMRTLQSIETICSLEKNTDFAARDRSLSVAEGLYTTFYNARLHYAKALCYELALNEHDDVEKIHSMVVDLMDKHTDEIYTPATGTMIHLLYEAGLREEIDGIFAKLSPLIPDDQYYKRNLTALFHMFPEATEDDKAVAVSHQSQ